MKFLLSLSVLLTTAAFAQRGGDDWNKIKCYETAQQGGRHNVALVLAERDEHAINNRLQVVWPEQFKGSLEEERGCLVQEENGGGHGGDPTLEPSRGIKLCPTQGQSINGLVPFELSLRNDEETVYCDRSILRYLDNDLLTLK